MSPLLVMAVGRPCAHTMPVRFRLGSELSGGEWQRGAVGDGQRRRKTWETPKDYGVSLSAPGRIRTCAHGLGNHRSIHTELREHHPSLHTCSNLWNIRDVALGLLNLTCALSNVRVSCPEFRLERPVRLGTFTLVPKVAVVAGSRECSTCRADRSISITHKLVTPLAEGANVSPCTMKRRTNTNSSIGRFKVQPHKVLKDF